MLIDKTVLSWTQWYEWYICFKTERISTDEDPTPEWPTMSTYDGKSIL